MNLHIHQIYYLPSQLPLLDPAFTPYDNTANEITIQITPVTRNNHQSFDTCRASSTPSSISVLAVMVFLPLLRESGPLNGGEPEGM